jgi:two-component system, NarL family, nitrate/nitrite response regulator NarL
VRVVVADDHAFIRQGIRAMFEARGWTVSGEAADGQEAVELVQKLRPVLVVLDISMPVLNGLQAAKAIRASVPSTKIIVLSMHDSPHARKEALKAGADGYVTKTAEPAFLFETIESLLKP